jgi:hypothetical protein
MKHKIRKGMNLYLYYWAIPFFLFFILVNYFGDVFKLDLMRFFNIGTEGVNLGFMTSVVSFLFSFFISISFSIILAHVNVLKDNLAIEAGRLSSMFLLSKNLGEKFHKRVIDVIDRYTIITLRHYKHYELGRDIAYELNEDVKNLKVRTDREKAILGSFLGILADFQVVREKLEYLTKGRLPKAIKLTNYILAFLLIFLLFLNRGNPFANIMFVILSTVIVFILLIIEDYEDLRIGDYTANISHSEQLFDLIGKNRYYPKYLLGRVKLHKGRVYRIGHYNKKTKKEEIVKLEYPGGFNRKVNSISKKGKKKK